MGLLKYFIPDCNLLQLIYLYGHGMNRNDLRELSLIRLKETNVLLAGDLFSAVADKKHGVMKWLKLHW